MENLVTEEEKVEKKEKDVKREKAIYDIKFLDHPEVKIIKYPRVYPHSDTESTTTGESDGQISMDELEERALYAGMANYSMILERDSLDAKNGFPMKKESRPKPVDKKKRKHKRTPSRKDRKLVRVPDAKPGAESSTDDDLSNEHSSTSKREKFKRSPPKLPLKTVDSRSNGTSR